MMMHVPNFIEHVCNLLTSYVICLHISNNKVLILFLGQYIEPIMARKYISL